MNIIEGVIGNIPGKTQNEGNGAFRTEKGTDAKTRADSEKENRNLREACTEFESLFINYILKEMRETIPKTGLFSGGKAEEIYTSMMDVQLAKDIAHKGGFGLSKMLYNQFTKREDV